MPGAPGSSSRPLEASQMPSCRPLQQAAPAARQRRATPVVRAVREKPAWSDRSGRSHLVMEGRRHRIGTQARTTDSPGARMADPTDPPASRRSSARTRGRPAAARREPRTRSPSRSPGRRRRAARAGPKRGRRHRREPGMQQRKAAVSQALVSLCRRTRAQAVSGPAATTQFLPCRFAAYRARSAEVMRSSAVWICGKAATPKLAVTCT